MSDSPESIRHLDLELSDVTLHVARAGDPSGRPIVLIHGWPETSYAWRKMVPLLGDEFDLVMPDTRGMGGSSIPDSGYDKVTVAGDIVEMIERIELDRPLIVGHDWGGTIAFFVAAALQERASGLVVLDTTVPQPPGVGMSMNQGGKRWHHAFNRSALSDLLVPGREREFYGWFYTEFARHPEAIDETAFGVYMEAFADPRRSHAGFEMYRAIPQDELAAERVRAAGPLRMPVLGYGGAESWGRADEVVQSLRQFAGDVAGGSVPDSGHWIPEEQPAFLADRIRAFAHRLDAPVAS
ncbi:alpha/beta fold hydrolase [Compostimonas suwonensis]|uniref:Pimeloyl-ACP methyl ester carboxylesterase n=1 Tax=Compostimonas suwonensis TaxID=1048394 RepID=A0A2M9BBN6_9MICO|nr:alpha/beta hydrolase [Compostimonas suwonensis]PJJ55370.1 pimeloyl-ACP methyl ester carboxylesterase [Compostimonas suwonensis]